MCQVHHGERHDDSGSPSNDTESLSARQPWAESCQSAFQSGLAEAVALLTTLVVLWPPYDTCSAITAKKAGP